MNIVAGAIHMHSDYSHDGVDSLEMLRDACVARGIRWVAMTDHAEDLIPEVFDEYVKHCAALSDENVQFIPGLEFRFAGHRGVHLLALSLDGWIKPRTLEEFFDQTAKAARFTVLAHPVLCDYVVPSIVLERIDAIEVWNANYNTRYLPDPRAMDVFYSVRAKRPEVVATVGLDQHDSSNDRELRILVAQRSASDPISALKSGRFTNIGRTMSFDSHAAIDPTRMRWMRARRLILDAANSAHEKLIFAARRMGIDF